MDKPYGCEICKEAFASPTSLKNHMRTHSETFLFYCQFCPAGFTTKEYLIYHEYTHSSDEPYRCDLCGKTFKQKVQLKTHILYHNVENKFECKVCRKQFKSSSDLNNHQRIHSDTPYECGFCDKSFSTVKLLEAHQIHLHPQTNTFQCSKCPEEFSSAKDLRSHMSCHTVHRQHECPDCGKFLKTSATLAFHRRSMHNSGQKLDFHCEDCGKIFTSKNKLLIHKVIHRTVKCDICMMVFSNEIDLKWHVNSMHVSRGHNANDSTGSDSASPSFICRFCNKDFKSKLGLSRHEKYHLETPFACDKCDKKFRSEKQLKDHKQNKHGEEKYECFKCGQKFYLKANLGSHLLTHVTDKPFGCQFCASAFKQADELRSHLLLHNGDRPYFCTLCPSRFKHQAHLSSHLRTLHSTASVDNGRFPISASTDSLSEYDSADTEIYMMDTDDDSSSGKSSSENLNRRVNPSKIVQRQVKKSDEKAPISFLFCGKLEGQSIKRNYIDELSGCEQPQGTRGLHMSNGIQECSNQFELWDTGISSNAYRPFRKTVNKTESQNLHCNTGNSNHSVKIDPSKMYTATPIPTESDIGRQSLELPKLSNYAGTDNLMSWPSPQQINLLDSFQEGYLSESFDERHQGNERSNVQRFMYKKRLFEVNDSENGESPKLNNSIAEENVVYRTHDQITRKEMVPDVIINDLALNLTRTTSKDLAEFNYSSDVLDELLGNPSKTNLEQENNVGQVKMAKEIQKEAPFVARSSTHGTNINISYIGICSDNQQHIQQSKESNRFDIRTMNNEIENGNSSSMCLEKQQQMERISDITLKENCSFKTPTLYPKFSKDYSFAMENEKEKNDRRKRSHSKWENTSEADIQFKKRKRRGRFIRADTNVSFFIAKALSGQYSNVDELSSEDNDIADRTTVADSSSLFEEGDIHDSSDSYLADASTIPDDISLNESLLEESSRDSISIDSSLDSDVDTNYESSMEGDNSMTDNCSSAESEDDHEFQVRHQKSHTRECLLKKDRWLKRNFKFKSDKFGTRSCVSYVVYKKNYTDSNKKSLKCSKIGTTVNETTNLTEKKIAELRDIIRKKHITKPVEPERSPPEPTNLSDPLNLNASLSLKNVSKEQIFQIASPRYKTRFAQRKIAQKTASLRNDFAERTLVKSNINVRFNTIASPRYKTRYAVLKKAQKVNSEQVEKVCNTNVLKTVVKETKDPSRYDENKQITRVKSTTVRKAKKQTKKGAKNDTREKPALTRLRLTNIEKSKAVEKQKDDRLKTIAKISDENKVMTISAEKDTSSSKIKSNCKNVNLKKSNKGTNNELPKQTKSVLKNSNIMNDKEDDLETTSVVTSAESTVKLSRGRSLKTNAKSPEAEKAANIVKRGRGRPRKTEKRNLATAKDCSEMLTNENCQNLKRPVEGARKRKLKLITKENNTLVSQKKSRNSKPKSIPMHVETFYKTGPVQNVTKGTKDVSSKPSKSKRTQNCKKKQDNDNSEKSLNVANPRMKATKTNVKIPETKKINHFRKETVDSTTENDDMLLIDLTDDEELPKLVRIKRKRPVSKHNNSISFKDDVNIPVNSDIHVGLNDKILNSEKEIQSFKAPTRQTEQLKQHEIPLAKKVNNVSNNENPLVKKVNYTSNDETLLAKEVNNTSNDGRPLAKDVNNTSNDETQLAKEVNNTSNDDSPLAKKVNNTSNDKSPLAKKVNNTSNDKASAERAQPQIETVAIIDNVEGLELPKSKTLSAKSHKKNMIRDTINCTETDVSDNVSSTEKKLPFQQDGYLLSIPDFVVPSVENTRLKCKERERLFQKLIGNVLLKENNVFGQKTVEDRHKNRGRSRKRENRKQKRPTSVDSVFSGRTKHGRKLRHKKDSKRSSSADSVLSKGRTKHGRKLRHKKGSKRSSSADSVLSKGTKRHKALKHHKKHDKRTSRIDTVISTGSKPHKIMKKPSKRSSRADFNLSEASKSHKITKKDSKRLKITKKHSKRSSSADTILSEASKRHKITKKHSKRSSSADSVLSRGSSHGRNIFKTLQKFGSSLQRNGVDNENETLVQMSSERNKNKKMSRKERREKCLNVVHREAREISAYNQAETLPEPVDSGSAGRGKDQKKVPKSADKKTMNKSSGEMKSCKLNKTVFTSKRDSIGHFIVKEDICKKLRDKVEPVVEDFLKKSHPKTKNRTDKIWKSVLCNQPIIKLVRIDQR